MASQGKEIPAMSAFERKRLENIAMNQAILKDLGSNAAKIATKAASKPKTKIAPARKTTRPTRKEEARPTRTSSRLAGLEADSEGAKRKAEVEYEFAKEQAKAKRQRVTGKLQITDMIVDGKKFNTDNKFLNIIMKGAQPNVHTFTEDYSNSTVNSDLRSLREGISGLTLYEGYEPNQIKITPERVYSLSFHPSSNKPLVFAGDKEGNIGIFDASQDVPDIKAEDDEEDDIKRSEPIITALKIHSKTVTSLAFSLDGDKLYSSSYDSSIREFDLQKGISIEAFAPTHMDEELPISCVELSPTDRNILYFSTLDGSFGRHDLRVSTSTEIWQLVDKKLGGFSLNPQSPHLVATASLDRTLKIWDLRNIKGPKDARAPSLMGEHESRLSVSHSSWSFSGHIATSSYDDTIKIHALPTKDVLKVGYELSEDEMAPNVIIKHNNQTGRWVTILKPHWQERPQDGIPKFVIGNMNRFVDVFSSTGQQVAQLGGEGITAVPAVAKFHPTENWIAGGTASGKLCLWM
ncbi:unnamed protein product [Blumeria hordei]|uniref:DNA damage-binding protein CMR1 n=2 Tax=Blumeria hordei TaxID=2867405 RepID=A0A383UTT9_BLUHO|nr:WD40 domain-containing protein [Blumeria hordei DH14]SZF03773.1 unnamed protein product [Blumeria hordei]